MPQPSRTLRGILGAPTDAAVNSPAALAARDARTYVASTPAQLRQFNQAATFGLADPGDAAWAALATGANNAIREATGRPSVGYGMGDAYNAVLGEETAQDRAFQQAHPYQSFGLQVLGGIANPASRFTDGFVDGARTLGGSTLRSGLAGVGTGALTGAAQAGPGESRVAGAVRGGVTGGLTGAAAPYVSNVTRLPSNVVGPYLDALGDRIAGILAPQ